MNKPDLDRHMTMGHDQDGLGARRFKLVASRHNDTVRQFAFELPPSAHRQIDLLLRSTLARQMFRLLQRQLRVFDFVQVSFAVTCQYAKLGGLGDPVDHEVFVFRTAYQILTRADVATWGNFQTFLESIIMQLMTRAENLLSVGSGWVMNFITRLDVHVLGRSIIGMSPPGRVPLRERIKKMLKSGGAKSCHQLTLDKCEDVLTDVEIAQASCFYASVAAGLAQKTSLPVLEKFLRHFKGSVTRPMALKKVVHFERQNGLAVNVFGWEGKDLIPYHLSRQDAKKSRINVLHLPPHSREEETGHYVLINNLSKFVTLLKRMGDARRSSREAFICELCLHVMVSSKMFESHKSACANPHAQKLLYPNKDSNLTATASAGKTFSPLFGFLDFEARMSPRTNEENFKAYNCDNCASGGPPKLCSHSERILCEQLPMTFSFYIVDHHRRIVMSRTYSSDEDVMKVFFKTLVEWQHGLKELLQANKELKWSRRLQEKFDRQSKCYLCQGPFLPGHKQFQKVRDHCHYTQPRWNAQEGCFESLFLGASHAGCNLQRRTNFVVPVYVHNFMSYDSNFLLKHLSNAKQLKNITAIPYNSNKLRTLTLHNFHFLDSYQIMNASLAQLSNDLRNSNHDWPVLRQVDLGPGDLQRLLRKSIYPYEWVRSVQQLRDAKELPPQDDFYSQLTGRGISAEDYEHGQRVYSEFGCRDMLEYTELYCKLDTLLLAEIVLTFRHLMKQKFNLWLENYISIPQLAYDAFLLQNKRPLQLCHDPTMVQMFENNIRGGVSFVNNRHVHRVQHSSDILYVDANNLYGFAQCLPLPVGDYRWLGQAEIDGLDLSSMVVDQPVGYVYEVDLVIPDELHEKLDDLPLAPEARPIVAAMLSPYSAQVQNELLGKKLAERYNSFKLVTGHDPKQRYVVHYLNLQFYCQLGCRITKVHQVIAFTQDRFLRSHIMKVSALRAKAKSKFEQLLFKLIVNSLYGKFIQNCRKFLNIKVCVSQQSLKKHTLNPKFHSIIPVNDKVSLILLRKRTVMMDKLYAVGFTILELSKLHMYQLWYGHVVPKLPPGVPRLILTDTDSFIIQLHNMDKLEALRRLTDIMDFSNYPPSHELFCPDRKKVPGYLKDEYPCQPIQQCVAVRSKCYFLEFDDSNATRVCKGIAQSVSKTFPIEYYLSCVYSTGKKIKATMHSIRANKHVITTKSITKICMSSGDDKRYQTCNMHSVAYGHHYIKDGKKQNCPKCPQHG